MNSKIIASTTSAGFIGVTLVALCFYIEDGLQARALNLTVLVSAAAMGWLVGVLLSPYDAKEKKEFPKYSAAVSAFISGYLASKLDRALEQVFRPEILLSVVGGFRVLSGLAAFATAVLITYIYRTYA